VARIYRVVLEASLSDGTLIQPSLHYQTDLSLGGSEPDPSDVAAGIWGHIGTAWLATFTAHTTVAALAALEEVIPPAIGAAGSHAVNLAGTLAGSGDQIPNGLVPVINLHTDTRSRSARGWFHNSSPRYADYVSQNVWSGGVVTAINNLCSLLEDVITIGSVITTDLRPGVYSRTRALRGESPDFFHLTGASLNPKCHWLRSRMSTP
jgi:hypothetical protein